MWYDYNYILYTYIKLICNLHDLCWQIIKSKKFYFENVTTITIIIVDYLLTLYSRERLIRHIFIDIYSFDLKFCVDRTGNDYREITRAAGHMLAHSLSHSSYAFLCSPQLIYLASSLPVSSSPFLPTSLVCYIFNFNFHKMFLFKKKKTPLLKPHLSFVASLPFSFSRWKCAQLDSR